MIPYNPLAGGLLTGKHRPGAPTEGTRFTLGRSQEMYRERYWQDQMFATVDELRGVAEDCGVPLTTLGNPVGAGQSGDHVSDRRRQPTRAAGGVGGGRRVPDQPTM